VATLAGAPLPTATRLAVSMLAIQVSIGALNDVVDRPVDASQKPAKPLGAGLLPPRAGFVVAAAGLAIGLALSAPSGLATLAVAAAGASLGYIYDLRLSRTAWSWLPLAVALPLLPVHAWLGATGRVPAGLLALVPTALLAGAALALANGLVDVERDLRAGRRAVAVALGARRAWLIHVVLLVAVGLLVVFVAPAVPGEPAGPGAGGSPSPGSGIVVVGSETLRLLRTWAVIGGLAAMALGAVVLLAARASLRERGWELEAAGVAAAGLGWLAGTAAATDPGAGLAL
jgi:4-hydroxybenzoate polyprenyltransferase